jgi:hypothetical protein
VSSQRRLGSKPNKEISKAKLPPELAFEEITMGVALMTLRFPYLLAQNSYLSMHPFVTFSAKPLGVVGQGRPPLGRLLELQQRFGREGIPVQLN